MYQCDSGNVLFLQAEDGIRDADVTGVQTCALPIFTLEPAFAAALERQTVLCYTGRSRVSGATIARVMGAYERGDREVTGALRAMRDVADAMAESLRASDLARVAELVTANWRQQQALDAEMRTSEMARLEQGLAQAGPPRRHGARPGNSPPGARTNTAARAAARRGGGRGTTATGRGSSISGWRSGRRISRRSARSRTTPLRQRVRPRSSGPMPAAIGPIRIGTTCSARAGCSSLHTWNRSGS